MVTIELPTLRDDYQTPTVNALRQALAKYRRVILCSSPGTGKTVMSKWILGTRANRQRFDGESGRALFAVQRRGLVDNAIDSFNQHPVLPHGVLMAGRKTAGGHPIQVGSIDTLNSWYCEGGIYDTDCTHDLVVYDECHSHPGKLRTFMEAHDRKRNQLGLRPAFLLGLSATPEHKELSNLFDHIVFGPKKKWLIDNNWLVPFRYFEGKQGNLSLLDKQGDEYTRDSVSAAMEGLAGDFVKDWVKHARDRATIGFFPRLARAWEAMELLRSIGVRAEYVDGDTPDDKRRKMFKDLNNGLIDYLCNVGILDRGTDIPRVSCIQLCTAMATRKRVEQTFGRGSRIHPESGKVDCIVLDHATNVKDHGYFEDEVKWTLEWSNRPSKTHEPRPTIKCPSCGERYRGGRCRCGYEPTPRERKAQGLELPKGGELQEIKKRERKPGKQQSSERLFISALYKAAQSGRPYGSAWKIAKDMAEAQGTRFQLPAKFEVAGKVYEPIPWDHPDRKRKVSATYGFTVGKHSDSDNPYRIGEADS